MSEKRLKITQQMCDIVEYMIGKGRTPESVAQTVEISVSTVNRIRAAGYSAERYAEMKEERRQEDIRKREQAREQNKQTNFQKLMDEYAKIKEEVKEQNGSEQVPGQLMMQLPEEKKKEEHEGCRAVPYKVLESMIYDNVTKLIRFQAGEADKIMMKLSQLNDNVCQLLRAVRKE